LYVDGIKFSGRGIQLGGWRGRSEVSVKDMGRAFRRC
jgi:hypothetical protein